jgi:hypothetical protein
LAAQRKINKSANALNVSSKPRPSWSSAFIHSFKRRFIFQGLRRQAAFAQRLYAVEVKPGRILNLSGQVVLHLSSKMDLPLSKRRRFLYERWSAQRRAPRGFSQWK